MAAIALLAAAATCVLALVVAVREFPRGLVLPLAPSPVTTSRTSWAGVSA